MTEETLKRVFEIMDVSKLTKEQRELYEAEVKAKADWKADIDWAREQATIRTLLNVGLEMKREGLSNEQIVKLTKLSIEEIEELPGI